MKAFCCWSGGKDSVLSFYKAKKAGVDIFYLVNMIDSDGRYSRSHGLLPDLLKVQTESIGVPVVQRKTTLKHYEEEFKKTVLDLKKEDIKAGVFGDIYLQEHKDWIERVCKEVEIEPIFPLWGCATENLIKEFIEAQFKAIVVATQADILGQEWLGKQIDDKFVKDIKAIDNIDLCGEGGEFHTFVYDGPIFKESIKFATTGKVFRENRWFLEIIPET